MPTNAVIRATFTSPTGLGAVSFHGTNDFWLPTMQLVVDRYVRLGGTGSGVQSTMMVGTPAPFRGYRCEASSSVAIANIVRWEGFEGQILTILDAWGRNIPRARLTGCAATAPRQGKGPLDDAGNLTTLLVYYSATVERLPDSSS